MFVEISLFYDEGIGVECNFWAEGKSTFHDCPPHHNSRGAATEKIFIIWCKGCGDLQQAGGTLSEGSCAVQTQADLTTT